MAKTTRNLLQSILWALELLKDHKHLIAEPFMKVNGKMSIGMDMVNKNGQMVQGMKETG